MEWMKAWIKWDKGIPADRLYPLHPISPVFTREASSYDMIQYIPLVYSQSPRRQCNPFDLVSICCRDRNQSQLRS